MYEARQNKEKVSRRIDGGSGMARQKVNNTILKNYIIEPMGNISNYEVGLLIIYFHIINQLQCQQ